MRVTLKMFLAIPLSAVILIGCQRQTAENAQPGATDTSTATQQVRVETRQADPYGTYLTDAEGMSLYLFMADSSMTSTCYDACAEAWPPLMAPVGDPEAGEGVNAALLSTFERTDGSTQVAYNDWPLYYFAQDTAPGQTKGQDVNGFGGDWYLVSPEGEPIRTE